MTVLLDPSMLSELESCRTRLSKKATFESAIADVCLLVKADHAQTALQPVQVKLLEVCARCMTLLKTRYTSSAFWKAGKDLISSCQGVVVSPVDDTRMRAWHSECASMLDEASLMPAESGTAAAPPVPETGYLFEGQLSQAQEPPARPQGLEDLLHLLAAQQVASRTEGDAEPDELQQVDNAAYTQRLEEALIASLADAEGGVGATGAPAASKHAVKSLVREQLTGQRLQQLGGSGTECAVCREDLQVGEQIQIMPCNSNHVYHPDCLAPWLKEHNSCPVCRFELPTDDMAYENKKERDQREAEDRKGAANAVSHTDFLYT